MQSGPRKFSSLSLAKALVSCSYEIGKSITGGISSESRMILSCASVSMCCYVYSVRLLVIISK